MINGNSVSIKGVANGYIVTGKWNWELTSFVFESLDEALAFVVTSFESCKVGEKRKVTDSELREADRANRLV